jgi:quinol monooxygenase YgiN
MTHAPLTVIARLHAEPGREPQLRDALLALLAPTRRAAGCLTYDLLVDDGDAARFWLQEVWVDRAAHAANLASAHVQEFLARAPDLLRSDLEVDVLRPVDAGPVT